MKIAVISGASSGLGNAFAKVLDDYKLDEIWVIARREDRLNALKDVLNTPVRVFAFDLLRESSFETFKQILKMEDVEIKYLVNAAGFGMFGSYDLPLEKVNQMIDLNVKALVNMTYLCIPYMCKGSTIMEICSIASFTPLMNFNIYASTKAFVLHFSLALNEELKKKGIRVCALCPGWSKTEFFNQARKDNKYAPKFIKPMYEPDFVVKKGLNDAKTKAMSIPGVFTKAHYVASRILPKKAVMTIWKWMQKTKAE